MRAAYVTVIGKVHGRRKAQIGMSLIRLGAWFCRDFRVSVKVNGVETTTYRPEANVSLTLSKTS